MFETPKIRYDKHKQFSFDFTLRSAKASSLYCIDTL